MSAGKKFRNELQKNKPLQILGVINAYSAIQAKKAGAKAIYLSGAGVANASYGLPDLGMTMLEDVCIDIRRITSRSDVPLLVDADTGWGGAFNIARTVKEMTKAGAAGCHIEDRSPQTICFGLSSISIVVFVSIFMPDNITQRGLFDKSGTKLAFVFMIL